MFVCLEQTRVTFELYYRGPGDAPLDCADAFYRDDNVDDDQRLLIQEAPLSEMIQEAPVSEIDINTSSSRRDDGAAAPTSTSSARS